MKILPLLVIALIASPTLAETSIHAGGFSYHVATGYKNDYNNNHKLLAVEHNGEITPRIVNCLSNLRPIWSEENIRKGRYKEFLI